MHNFNMLLKLRSFKSTLLHNGSNLKSSMNFSVSVMNCRECTEFKIPTPWGHIAGKEWGSNGDHPVIAVHGWQDSSASFDTLIPLLKKKLHIYALDLPGHGLSSYLPKGMIYSHMTNVNAIFRVAEHFKLKSFYAIGHSLGAEAVYKYASTYPEKVSHFIALDSFKPKKLYPNQIAALMRQTMEYGLRIEKSESCQPQYTKEELINKISSILGNSITKESAEILFPRAASKCSNDKYIFNRDTRLKFLPNDFRESDDIAMLYGSAMRCHVLFVKAKPGTDFEAPVVERCSIEVLRNCLPSLRYEEVAGSHFVHLNSPEKVAPLINQVLELK